MTCIIGLEIPNGVVMGCDSAAVYDELQYHLKAESQTAENIHQQTDYHGIRKYKSLLVDYCNPHQNMLKSNQ